MAAGDRQPSREEHDATCNRGIFLALNLILVVLLWEVDGWSWVWVVGGGCGRGESGEILQCRDASCR